MTFSCLKLVCVWLLLILQKLRRGEEYSTEPLEAAVASFINAGVEVVKSSLATSDGVTDNKLSHISQRK
jgi:hypothetical protein